MFETPDYQTDYENIRFTRMNQDFVWGYALILVGALLAVVVMRYGAARLRKEELAADQNDWKLGRWWDLVLVGFVPFAAITLLVWWFVQEAKPGQWYNPLDPTSVMNCLLQWAIVLVALLVVNRWLAMRPPEVDVHGDDG